jgi:signal peptidase I
MAVSGDTLQLKRSIVYINGEPAFVPPKSQMQYMVTTGGQQLDEEVMKDEYDLDIQNDVLPGGKPNTYSMLLTEDARQKLLKNKIAISIDPILDTVSSNFIYPNGNSLRWSVDNFGPIWIPKKGEQLH